MTVAILALGIVSGALANNRPEFSPEEADYIARTGVIRMCVDPDWAPFERINAAGQHEGIAADLIQQVAERVGLRIVLHPTKTWDESLAASQAGHCQIMSFLNQTPKRETWLNFTAPIFFDPNVIITREEHPFIANARGLRNERVALPRGTMVEERIRALYPNLDIVLTDNEADAIALVSDRQVEMTIRSLIVAAWTIKKEGLFNLKIAGQIPELTNQLRIGILKEETLLRDILDKGVATLTDQDREAIANRHVAVVVKEGIDHVLFWQILAVGALIFLVSLFWNQKLRKVNRELERLSVTDRLTGLFNRAYLDRKLDEELQRAQRFGTAFSVILIDIDHFKEVNDSHGHPTGDRVLIEFAQVLRTATRETDMVGRWGGEEFMIICPHTHRDGAGKLSEQLRNRIAERAFPVPRGITASFGVTAYQPDDRAAHLTARADQALYTAKHNGRNRIEFA